LLLLLLLLLSKFECSLLIQHPHVLLEVV